MEFLSFFSCLFLFFLSIRPRHSVLDSEETLSESANIEQVQLNCERLPSKKSQCHALTTVVGAHVSFVSTVVSMGNSPCSSTMSVDFTVSCSVELRNVDLIAVLNHHSARLQRKKDLGT